MVILETREACAEIFDVSPEFAYTVRKYQAPVEAIRPSSALLEELRHALGRGDGRKSGHLKPGNTPCPHLRWA